MAVVEDVLGVPPVVTRELETYIHVMVLYFMYLRMIADDAVGVPPVLTREIETYIYVMVLFSIYV